MIGKFQKPKYKTTRHGHKYELHVIPTFRCLDSCSCINTAQVNIFNYLGTENMGHTQR